MNIMKVLHAKDANVHWIVMVVGFACLFAYEIFCYALLYLLQLIAEKAGVVYNTPWEIDKVWGCLCDKGWRGVSCEQQVILLAISIS